MKNIPMSEFNDKPFAISSWTVEFGVKYGSTVEFTTSN